MSRPGPPAPGAARRVAVAPGELLRREPPERPGHPLLIRPAVEGVRLAAWASGHREELDGLLAEHGAVLFRGFGLGTPEELDEVVRAACGEPLRYTYASTPRTQVQGGVYTSTEYPADQTIPLHNEMAYSRQWPMKIWFLCVLPAPEGGETPLADSHRVYERIPDAVRRRFEELGVMYVRNYGGGLDLPWQEVFGTPDRGAVEAFCRDAGIDWEWRGEDGLRTRQVCQGVARHPRTGRPVWFNQAHLFHVSALPPALGESLLADLGPEAVPRNSFYGDGSPIEAAALAAVRSALDAEEIVFPWRRGDLLLLDNMWMAHGRRPFRGPRRILVEMAEAHG